MGRRKKGKESGKDKERKGERGKEMGKEKERKKRDRGRVREGLREREGGEERERGGKRGMDGEKERMGREREGKRVEEGKEREGEREGAERDGEREIWAQRCPCYHDALCNSVGCTLLRPALRTMMTSRFVKSQRAPSDWSVWTALAATLPLP